MGQSASTETVSPIFMPGTPKPAQPPRPNGDVFEENLDKKREKRQRRDRLTRPPRPSYAASRDKSLLEEAVTKRPLIFMAEVSFVGVSAQTSSGREGYTADPTSHFSLSWRHAKDKNPDRLALFYGLRLAPFNGTGFYHSIPGSYGFTYFGPMVGIGKIAPVPLDHGAGQRPGQDGFDLPVVSGWLLSAGIAAQSRMGRADTVNPQDVAGEFDTKGVDFDVPGLWVETRYITLHWGAVGFNAVFGIQTGRGKQFLYGGLGIAGWY